jgi:hypothetical protein
MTPFPMEYYLDKIYVINDEEDCYYGFTHYMPITEVLEYNFGIAPQGPWWVKTYIATWTIENKKLYFVNITGHVFNLKVTPDNLFYEDFFDDKGRVFAFWYSGNLKVWYSEQFYNVDNILVEKTTEQIFDIVDGNICSSTKTFTISDILPF